MEFFHQLNPQNQICFLGTCIVLIVGPMIIAAICYCYTIDSIFPGKDKDECTSEEE